MVNWYYSSTFYPHVIALTDMPHACIGVRWIVCRVRGQVCQVRSHSIVHSASDPTGDERRRRMLVPTRMHRPNDADHWIVHSLERRHPLIAKARDQASAGQLAQELAAPLSHPPIDIANLSLLCCPIVIVIIDIIIVDIISPSPSIINA